MSNSLEGVIAVSVRLLRVAVNLGVLGQRTDLRGQHDAEDRAPAVRHHAARPLEVLDVLHRPGHQVLVLDRLAPTTPRRRRPTLGPRGPRLCCRRRHRHITPKAVEEKDSAIGRVSVLTGGGLFGVVVWCWVGTDLRQPGRVAVHDVLPEACAVGVGYAGPPSSRLPDGLRPGLVGHQHLCQRQATSQTSEP